MKLITTSLEGLYLVEPEVHRDERGYFFRNHCENEFKSLGLCPQFVQSSLSYSRDSGTLRGLHFQITPHEETKLVQCLRGKIYDVILDLRPNSPTFRNWEAFELDSEVPKLLYVPGGCAHGYLTLTPDVLIQYRMDVPFHAESQRGYRWNDPAFGILWPLDPRRISERDRSFPDYTD